MEQTIRSISIKKQQWSMLVLLKDKDMTSTLTRLFIQFNVFIP